MAGEPAYQRQKQQETKPAFEIVMYDTTSSSCIMFQLETNKQSTSILHAFKLVMTEFAVERLFTT